jgi:hypothetical protein
MTELAAAAGVVQVQAASRPLRKFFRRALGGEISLSTGPFSKDL